MPWHYSLQAADVLHVPAPEIHPGFREPLFIRRGSLLQWKGSPPGGRLLLPSALLWGQLLSRLSVALTFEEGKVVHEAVAMTGYPCEVGQSNAQRYDGRFHWHAVAVLQP